MGTEEKVVENIDAKRYAYPCKTCSIANPEKCTMKRCDAWSKWFGARWKEVTQPFLPVKD